VPERVMTNAEFEPLVGKPVDQWLIEKVGIRERHVMADDQATSDLIVPAAQQALERADLNGRVILTSSCRRDRHAGLHQPRDCVGCAGEAGGGKRGDV
jgi:hypothetical protein